ncbi:MAG: potassium transporter TrkG, partial [Syntrophales bacterium]
MIFLQIKRAVSRRMTPPRIFILSFALLILIGAVLLWLPFAAEKGRLSFLDALFSSASAVCVTGLAVIDIGSDLSFAGQLVTLFLFQIGGLGIITFSVVIFGLLGRGVSFRERELIQSSFFYAPRRDFVSIIRKVLKFTFIVEAAGAVILFGRFLFDFPPPTALYHAIYNAVSAFNNCGYSLFYN